MDAGEILKLELRRTKVKDLLEYLTEHDKHCDRVPYRIAWKIKVRCNEGNLSDPKIRKGYGLQEKWDERWEEKLEVNHNLFDQACEDGLDFVGDTHDKKHASMCPWTTKEGDEFDYEICQAGRSGGWIELHRFEGAEVKLDDFEDQYGLLRETEESYTCPECEGRFVNRSDGKQSGKVWHKITCHDPERHTEAYYEDIEDNGLADEDWLEKLVRFCKSLDEFDASKELKYQLAFRREELEERWEEERKEEIREAGEAEECCLAF